jgi:quercetin 2,3-dioxygenase
MTFEFASRPQGSPLPGAPVPYFLSDGDGEHGVVIDSLATVLLSADETQGQFGMFTMDAPKGGAIPAHSHGTHHEIFEAGQRFDTKFMPDYRLDT